MSDEPKDGASRRCKQCGGSAVFNRRTEVNMVAAVDKFGMRDPGAPQPEIVPAWRCSDCGHIERL